MAVKDDDKPSAWETRAKSYIEEAGGDLVRAGEDCNEYSRGLFGEWILTGALLNAQNAVRKLEYGIKELRQSRLPNFVEEAVKEEAEK